MDEKEDSAFSNEEPDGHVEYRYIDFDTPLPSEVRRYMESLGPEKRKQLRPDKIRSPQNMSSWRRITVSWMCYIASGLASHAASGYSPAREQLSAYWNIGNVATLVGITMFTTGFALAPMALAPLSEVNGRKPVFIGTGLLFVVCQLCCGLTRSYSGMLLARFFAGVGSSTYSSMVGGVISDIYRPEERNTPMALFSCTALFGIGTGAIASGFTAQYTIWRWIFYSQAIVDGVFVALLILLFPETRASVLLRWKAAKFNALHEEMEHAARLSSSPATTTTTTTSDPPSPPPTRIRWRSEQDEQQRGSLAATITTSLTRPFHLLLTEPVAFFFSLWAAFAWATLYVALAAVPLVFSTTHAFTLAQSNAVFAAMCAGAVVITPVSIYQERWARRRGLIPHAGAPPEARLYFSCVESALLPAGLFLFGWTAAGRGDADDVHWVVPALAVGVATMGVFSVYLAVFNYLSDAYGRFASSALAAQSFCRNGLGGVLTLVTRRMFVDMGYGPAGSCLGGVALALTMVPWVLVLYGERIRARSKFVGSL
ncbi:putative transporter [Lasiodiplodia hormozganensis]|uniref:Transporter n=1 Tax=Lasiodiplodia hormozganensis TaxID=869390 RepID=A0AA40D7Q6_9PEZI|nr:putative transporter [Lasiodiplodia hormozganensis]